ncbi:MAG: hypothetical protein VXX39_02440 [Candidatus Thermoplasmatota archaeon]|nr:hypothetical protein [Candidatus Thermoplasmatota archaeon]
MTGVARQVGDYGMVELMSLLEEKRKLVDEKATNYRVNRDNLNVKTKEFTGARNELNSEVRELIQHVREQREIREQMNEIVREKKQARATASDAVRSAKEKLQALKGEPEARENNDRRRGRDRPETVSSLKKKLARLEKDFEMGKFTGKNEKKFFDQARIISRKIKDMQSTDSDSEDVKVASEELRAAMEEQERTHQEVTEAADAAQKAHELMLEWNQEVDRQREKAERAHRELRKSKKEADKAHHFYIVSLRCLHSIQDMLRAMKGAQSGETQSTSSRVEVQDLMSKLLSGETLSTEELMQLQRGD